VGVVGPGRYFYCVLHLLSDRNMEEKNITPEKKLQEQMLAQINIALGLFLLGFSLIIFVAIYYTKTFVGQMTNLAAGLILAGVGGGMIYYALKKRKRTRNSSDVSGGNS